MSPGRGRPGRSDEPQALGAVLDVLGAERGLGAGLHLGALGRVWEAVVGERLAEESAPAALDDGVLLVRASSSAWAAQIRFLSKEIRDGANRVLLARTDRSDQAGAAPGKARGDPVREVRVVVDRGPRAP